MSSADEELVKKLSALPAKVKYKQADAEWTSVGWTAGFDVLDLKFPTLTEEGYMKEPVSIENYVVGIQVYCPDRVYWMYQVFLNEQNTGAFLTQVHGLKETVAYSCGIKYNSREEAYQAATVKAKQLVREYEKWVTGVTDTHYTNFMIPRTKAVT